MQVAITGSTGLIGSALSDSLRADGHRVRPVVRRAASGPDELSMDALDLSGTDAVVHLAGEPIGAKRWSPEQKRKIRDSRIDGTARITAAVVSARVPVLVSASGVHYYGDRGDDAVTEESPHGTGFLPELCVEWEAATAPAAEAGTRVVRLRQGVVMAREGGALAKMLPLFKLGLGGRMGSGDQWVAWIGLEDEVRAIRHLLDHDVSGPVNMTAPNPVTNAEQAKVLGRVLHRPAVLPTPAFGPKLLLGAELADTLINDSIRALPTVLPAAGFEFRHPDLESALRSALQ